MNFVIIDPSPRQCASTLRRCMDGDCTSGSHHMGAGAVCRGCIADLLLPLQHQTGLAIWGRTATQLLFSNTMSRKSKSIRMEK